MKMKGIIKKGNNNEEWASVPKQVKVLTGL
jgi:hypothetical protein